MKKLPQLEDLPDPSGKRVLLRTDLVADVPVDRASASLVPTIRWLQERGSEVTLWGRLGDLEPGSLEEQLGGLDERLGPLRLEELAAGAGGQGEDQAAVDRLVEAHNLYVNDAFGSCRGDDSVLRPPSALPSAAGRWLQREVDVLGGLRESPAHPFLLVIGGTGLGDKLALVSALLDHLDGIMVGGAIASTFLLTQGRQVGQSEVEPDLVKACRKLLGRSKPAVMLPHDLIALGADGGSRLSDVDLRPDWKAADIGTESALRFGDWMAEAATVLWTGPMGMAEEERFGQGTRVVATALATISAKTVALGGDTASALESYGKYRGVDHVSSDRRSALELLKKGDLPGLAALRRAGNAPGND